jgi:hypothetical protein
MIQLMLYEKQDFDELIHHFRSNGNKQSDSLFLSLQIIMQWIGPHFAFLGDTDGACDLTSVSKTV